MDNRLRKSCFVDLIVYFKSGGVNKKYFQ